MMRSTFTGNPPEDINCEKSPFTQVPSIAGNNGVMGTVGARNGPLADTSVVAETMLARLAFLAHSTFVQPRADNA